MASDEWVPLGVERLEPEALKAVFYKSSAYVVAGPGAGKTEFLARAAYLLQTGLCPNPQRILAISFKADAASNLRRRVRDRCGTDVAARLDSMTFDAFTKGLVDRFGALLPKAWKLSGRYEVVFPNTRQVGNFLDALGGPPEWRSEIASLNRLWFEAHHVGGKRLEMEPEPPASGEAFAVAQWWNALARSSQPKLSFTLINRLAELLVRSNDCLQRALTATYPFVFADEFQDATTAQYDFLYSVFADSTVTAVGDRKQRIMGWAGALPNSFEQFASDFDAEQFSLSMNFRSSAELVRVQQVVARRLDADVCDVISAVHASVDDDVVAIWTYSDTREEARDLARWVHADMQARSTSPNDYALLVRQRPEDFADVLIEEFDLVGLSIRDEARKIGRTTLQDLLVDFLAATTAALLRLACGSGDRKSWMTAVSALRAVRSIDEADDVGCRRVESALDAFVDDLQGFLASTDPDVDAAAVVGSMVEAFLDPAALRQSVSEYRYGDNLEIALEACGLLLRRCAEKSPSWQECTSSFEGSDSVSLLTVHKSKGLEYDTVISIGIDDQTWWSHKNDREEGTATFFVGLSRAKQRAIFTYCEARGGQNGVADLYELLSEAGVPTIRRSSESAN